MTREELMAMAAEISHHSVGQGGGPFGAVIARGGQVVATGSNSVTLKCDPTAHAEVSAIREACARLGDFKLEGCEIYTSCEPCPMCLSAIYWAGIDRIYYANTRQDAARIGFDDSLIYDQVPLDPALRNIPAVRIESPRAAEVFREWEAKEDKIEY